MKKKILVFLSVFSICLFGLFNTYIYSVSAETDKYVYKLIEFSDLNGWELEAINTNTFTVSAIIDVPGIYRIGDINEVIEMYTRHALTLTKGTPNPTYQHYMFEETDNLEKVRLIISLNKLYYENWCINYDLCVGDGNNPDVSTLHLYMSQYFFGYYLARVSSSHVMKNFLLAEPNLENGFEHVVGFERYYMYLDARVYLPDGTTVGLTSMPDVISDRPDLFAGYDFIAISFNLSPRARFWSPSIYPSESISGLSYIVYDLVDGTTTFYDYLGQVVYYDNRIIYVDTPQFIIPEAEAIDFQIKSAYEEGKTEGYKQGREEGIRAGKRQMQEEMQQVIDNLTEYYEEEVRKAYNKGKLEGVDEQFDIFGYLQALFGEQGLGRLLRLELLPGVSLGAVIMIPLAFWLVSFIMRWFR